jgi:RimJ/RimL family protein N-acetyltransferase
MVLRDVIDDDLDVFFEHQREPEALRIAAVATRDHETFLTHWRTRVLGSPDVRAATIIVGGAVAGNVVSWEGDGERLVGYWVGSAYWGRGVATAALAEFLAERELRRPLHACVAVENIGSIRVLEKNGFLRIGDPVRAPDGVVEIHMRLEANAPRPS